MERTWECKCGQIKAKLKGEPILNFRCHCRSCVAAAQFIEEKTKKSGTPLLHSDGGGACASPYAAGQVEFITPLSDENERSKLKFVRVGDKGKPWRCYTKCCGTQMTNCVFNRLIAFNRNGIKNVDGSKFEPDDVLNIQVKHSFDPSAVPEPNHKTIPSSWGFHFMAPIMNPLGTKHKMKELAPEDSDTEIVPITWE